MAPLALALALSASTHASEASRQALFGAGPDSFLAAESTVQASVTIALNLAEARGEERSMLSLRGRRTRPGNSGTYNVSALVPHTPCAGEYAFNVAQEDDLTGDTLNYSALMRLSEPQSVPPGARCGLSPPRRAGSAAIALRGPEGKAFELEASRDNGGPFSGSLRSGVLPECDGNYRLETALSLSGWRRSAEFEVKMLAISAYFQGKEITKRRC